MIGLLFLLLLAICLITGIVLMIRGFVMYKDPSKSRMQFLISSLIFYVPRQIIIFFTIRYFYVIGWGGVSILIGIFEFFLRLFFAYTCIGKTASPSFRNHSERFSVFFLLNLILFAFWVGPTLAFKGLSEVYLFQYNYFNGYTYEVDTDEITIVKYSGGEKDIVIPSVIDGKPVTQIDAYAFIGNLNLTSVTISGSVRSIGNSAFERCRSLHTVTISEGVTSIGDSAFSSCLSLQEIVIPEGVTSIGSGAFRSSPSLTHVTLPASLTSIDENPFSYCPQLTEINVSPENSEFSSVEGILYTKNMDKIIAYPGGREGDFAIPDSVEDLGISAFESCEELTGVTISSYARMIGESAFYGCSSLEEVIIAEGVTNIGDYAFSNCSSLQEIVIPDSVTSIAYSAFPDNDILIIHCNKGSYAEAYAEVIKIKYELIEE